MYPRTLIVGHMDKDIDPDGLNPEEGQIADSDLVGIVAELGGRLHSKVLKVARVLGFDIDGIGSSAHNWTSEIISGDLEAAAHLLIALLPNLEKLRIVDTCRDCYSSRFHSMIVGLSEAPTVSKLELAGLNSFRHLSELSIDGETYSMCFSVTRCFYTLPSIRTIKGRYMDWETGPTVHRLPPVPCDSNITTLEFHQSLIGNNNFYECIRRIKSLQKFTYGFPAATTKEYPLWEPRGTVSILQAFASRSLVHLELTGVANIDSVNFRGGEPVIGSLRAFEVLETLRLQTVMLHKEDEEQVRNGFELFQIGGITRSGGSDALVEPERLVDILPASAKILRLAGDLTNEDADAMLADIVELKDERIPNLRTIFFENLDPSSGIPSVCEKVKIEANFC